VPLSQVKIKCQIGNWICLVVLLFWSAVVTLIQALFSERNLQEYMPRFDTLMRKHIGSLYGLFIVYLPAIGLMILLILIPYGLETLSMRFETRKSRSGIACSVLKRNLVFQLATLWVTVFSGTLFNSIHQMLREPQCTSYVLGHAIPKVSVYFTTFVIARIGVSLPLLLLRWPALLAVLRGRKPDPVYCDYPFELTNLAIVLVLGLTYSLVAPAILPCCTIFFGLASLLYRWLFLHVYVPVFDCAGAFWFELYGGVIAGIWLGCLSLGGLGLIYAGQASPQAISLGLLPFVVAAFHFYCIRHFKSRSSNMVYQDAVAIDREVGDSLWRTFTDDYYVDPVLKSSEADFSSSGSDEEEEELADGSSSESVGGGSSSGPAE